MARQVWVELRRGSEPLDLQFGELGVEVSRGEVAHQPDDLAAGHIQLGDPPAAHAGVELDVHLHALGDLAVGDHELEARIARIGDLAARGRPEHQHADGAECLPEREPFRNGRHAERGRARPERCAADVRGAVAVTVRLDHRPQLGALEHAQERARVAPDGAEIDRQVGSASGWIVGRKLRASSET